MLIELRDVRKSYNLGRPSEAEVLPGELRFLSADTLPLLFDFPLDMARVPAEVNRLSNQALVHTYEREWGKH